jgi:hypothetical protein
MAESRANVLALGIPQCGAARLYGDLQSPEIDDRTLTDAAYQTASVGASSGPRLTSDLRDVPAGAVVLELRDGRCAGQLNDVSHDLRDFLRRNALPCGDDETFRGLPTTPFARLQHPQQSADGLLA